MQSLFVVHRLNWIGKRKGNTGVIPFNSNFYGKSGVTNNESADLPDGALKRGIVGIRTQLAWVSRKMSKKIIRNKLRIKYQRCQIEIGNRWDQREAWMRWRQNKQRTNLFRKFLAQVLVSLNFQEKQKVLQTGVQLDRLKIGNFFQISARNYPFWSKSKDRDCWGRFKVLSDLSEGVDRRCFRRNRNPIKYTGIILAIYNGM